MALKYETEHLFSFPLVFIAVKKISYFFFFKNLYNIYVYNLKSSHRVNYQE